MKKILLITIVSIFLMGCDLKNQWNYDRYYEKGYDICWACQELKSPQDDNSIKRADLQYRFDKWTTILKGVDLEAFKAGCNEAEYKYIRQKSWKKYLE